MNKKIAIIIIFLALTIAIILVVWLLTSKERSQEKNAPKTTEALMRSCQNSGGEWKEQSNPCDYTCDYQRRILKGEELSCITVVLPGCQCEKNKCWDGETCVPL
jgi:uncharacterized protein YneF (UPF0154 family)